MLATERARLDLGLEVLREGLASSHRRVVIVVLARPDQFPIPKVPDHSSGF